ncbi:hypothetical protein EV421DRAFT_1734930 [Armillaria borealis]|uniref:Uncharacterized protein n=1 Tax=Armillaria borealis TaxID=47425 RepID=A0AA39JP31_9AGAR|nr:hypothetical protein EV421DRAFT_1734930 [Armillaria borealis]
MSSILENGGDEKRAPVGVAVEREWGQRLQGWGQNVEHGISSDGIIVGGNGWHHSPSKMGVRRRQHQSETSPSEGEVDIEEWGKGCWASLATMAAFLRETVSIIISGTLENGGEETMAPVRVVVECGWVECFGEVGPSFMGGVSATMAALLGEMEGVIFSGGLENDSVEQLLFVGADIKYRAPSDAALRDSVIMKLEAGSDIISSTLKKGDVETTAPVEEVIA